MKKESHMVAQKLFLFSLCLSAVLLFVNIPVLMFSDMSTAMKIFTYSLMAIIGTMMVSICLLFAYMVMDSMDD